MGFEVITWTLMILHLKQNTLCVATYIIIANVAKGVRALSYIRTCMRVSRMHACTHTML